MSDRYQSSSQKSDTTRDKSGHNRHLRDEDKHRHRRDVKMGSNDSYGYSGRHRDERHHRRQDDRFDRDSSYRSKGRDHSSSYHSSRGSDRKDRSKSSRNRSRSRSRSRSRDRNADKMKDNKTTRPTEPSVSIPAKPMTQTTNESKAFNAAKGIGIQHKTSLDIMKQQIQLKTGITVPDYYNPGVVNPIRFAEQERKRKLLWSRDDTKKTQDESSGDDVKKSGTTSAAASVATTTVKSNQWNGMKFSGEKGTEMTEKFRKLMGIKDNSNKELSSSSKNESTINESQETLFRNLDYQYSVARISTHTQRGVGLGFGGPK